MAPSSYRTYRGTSRKSIDQAIERAVESYEQDWGKPKRPVRLRVVEMSVTVTNPVRDYRVELGPGG
jgi:flavin-binding protein dodecin